MTIESRGDWVQRVAAEMEGQDEDAIIDRLVAELPTRPPEDTKHFAGLGFMVILADYLRTMFRVLPGGKR